MHANKLKVDHMLAKDRLKVDHMLAHGKERGQPG
jgi:hypothetical protein